MSRKNHLPSVTVLGSINLDITHHASRLPGPGETVIASAKHAYLGGKGANQAVAIARMGGDVEMIGAVGRDDHGDFAYAELAAAGVVTRAVKRSNLPTGTAAITIDSDGENQIVVFPGANGDIALPFRLPDSDVLLCQLEVDLETVERAVSQATGFVAINAAPALALSDATLHRADLMVVNELEWEALPQLQSCRHVVVTLGSKGALYYERGIQKKFVPAVPTAVSSSVGAGDAFTAAIALGFASGMPVREAMEAAAAVGAHAVSLPESQPALHQFLAYL